MKINLDINNLDIPTYCGENIKEIDSLNYPRINIMNYNMDDGQKVQNYYVFPIPDENSSTGYIGMAVNKDVYLKLKESLENSNG